jgi:hypothetical protein
MVYFAAQRRSLRLHKDGAGITSAAQRRTIMSTTTTTLDARDSVGERSSGSGWLDRAFRRFMARREVYARAIVDAHLASLPEASLVDLGFESADIRRIRASAGSGAYYWI